MNVGFPDPCTTPAAPSPIVLPYPNLGANSMSMPFTPNVLLSGMPGHNMAAKPLLTNGDNAGTLHPLFMQPGGCTLGNPIVQMNALPAETLLSPTYGNNNNNPVGVKAIPSVTNVLVCSLGGLSVDLLGLFDPSLGLTVDPTPHGLQVVHVRRDGLAHLLGVRSGDQLRAVNGVAVAAVTDLPAIGPGERCAFSVLRGGEAVELIGRRRARRLDVVGTEVAADGCGILTIHRFGLDLPAALRRALSRVRGRRLILDLRGNPGGAAVAAQHVAGAFLPARTVVGYAKTPRGLISLRVIAGDTEHTDDPLVVVVDRHTASAAELLAHALQAYGRATVVGEPTARKARGRLVLPAGPSRLVRVLGPARTSWGDTGVQPDVAATTESALEVARAVAASLARQ